MRKVLNLLLIIFIFFLCACSSNKEKKDTSELYSKAMTTKYLVKRSGTKFTSEKARESGLMERDVKTRLQTGGGMFGKDGLTLGGNNNNNSFASLGMPINPFLWQASLESISFMPLASADPFAGIIISEWYNDGTKPNERCKINIFIKGVELVSDNLKATIFCQETVSNEWVDRKVDNDKSRAFENVILENAKKIRLSSL